MKANVCPEGGPQWMALVDHLPFARALRDAATGPTLQPGDVPQAAIFQAMTGGAQPVVRSAPPPAHAVATPGGLHDEASSLLVSAPLPGAPAQGSSPPASPPVDPGPPPQSDGDAERPPGRPAMPAAPPGFLPAPASAAISSKPDTTPARSAKLDRTQRLEEAVESSWDGLPEGPSAIPPSGEPEVHALDAPIGSRTPAKPLEAVDFLGELPPNAPAWMHHAQRMVAGLQNALTGAGDADESTVASIERAWAAWELDGSSERQIARLALLCEETHGAVRNAPPERREKTIVDCAGLLRQGIPRHVRAKIRVEDVARIIRKVAEEADAWVAVVDATSEMLGWINAGKAHAAQMVRLAIIHTRAAKPQ